MKFSTIFNSKQIKTATIGSLGIKFLSALFALLNSVLLARILGVEHFGIYIIAFTTTLLLSIPVTLGLPTLITRYISKYDVQNNDAAIKGLLIRSNQLVFITSLVIIILAGVGYLFWWKSLDAVLVETLWVSFLLIPLMALGSLRSAALRGLRFVILGQLPDTLLRNLLLFLGVVMYYLLGYNLSPVKAILIHAIAAAVSYAVGYVFLKKRLLQRLKNITPVFHSAYWMKQAIPFSVNSGIQVVKSRFITYILAVVVSLEAVAIFDVALRAAALVSFALDAINKAIAPYISRTFEKGDLSQLQQIISKASRVIFIFAIPVVLVFVIGGKPLLVVMFGEEYDASYIPLVILCVGQLVNAITGSVGLVLNMTGHQAYFTKVTAFVTLINLVVSIPIVMLYNVVGAAYVYATLLILQNVILVWYVRKNMNINTTIF